MGFLMSWGMCGYTILFFSIFFFNVDDKEPYIYGTHTHMPVTNVEVKKIFHKNRKFTRDKREKKIGKNIFRR